MIYIFLSLTTFLFTILVGNIIIKLLKDKKYGQYIRKCGPKTHFNKIGTPSMGGIIFIIPIFLYLLLFNNYKFFIILFGILCFGILGFYDDIEKIIINKKKGISVKNKFSFQVIISVVISILVCSVKNKYIIGFSGNIFFKVNILIYILFIMFFILSEVNAVNLTDGLDGLATLVTIPIIVFFMIISILKKEYNLILLSVVIISSLSGFYIFNKHPAKIFMGDTGSMVIGFIVSIFAIYLDIELLLLPVGFIYFLEAISVLLQVSYFKVTSGKRLFKMTPIHHHFELLGYSEKKIVKNFSFFSFLFSLVGLILFRSF